MCIPGIGPLDEAAAIVLAQLVERQGIGARAEQADALSMSRIFSLDAKDVVLICLCYVGNATCAQIGMLFVASDERLPAFSLSYPFLEMPPRSKDLSSTETWMWLHSHFTQL